VGQEKVKVYISEFYKGLFGAPSKNNFTLVQNSRYSSIILGGNNIITIIHKEGIMRRHKANGKNKARWVSRFWEVIKSDILNMFTGFKKGE
jgi:hypothetical protein